MSGIKMSIDGIPALEKELQRLNGIRFDAVVELQANEMVDRATASKNRTTVNHAQWRVN